MPPLRDVRHWNGERKRSPWGLQGHWGGKKRKLKGIFYIAETSRELAPLMMKTLLGFSIFSSCEPIESFHDNCDLRKPGKIPCYVICIWRWHMLMRTLASHRAGCCYSWGWKLLLQLKKVVQKCWSYWRILFSDVTLAACSPGWKMKHCVFIGHLEYLRTSMHANI